MNDLGQKDVDTYVRNLILEKFKSRQGDANGPHKDKEQKVCICSTSKSENPGTYQKHNRIDDNASKG